MKKITGRLLLIAGFSTVALAVCPNSVPTCASPVPPCTTAVGCASAPELDAGYITAALSVVGGAALIIRTRMRK